MKKHRTIQVFEHSVLAVDGQDFTQPHFDKLVQYNEQHGNQFFSVGHRKIYFRNYVGVIQVGRLAIEILPKADRDGENGNADKWRPALINMLRECRYLKLRSLTEASLRLRSASLVDLYFDSFLSEVESLVHQGLVKQYRFHEENQAKLVGQIQFDRQVTKNLVHRERFFTRHQVYGRDNVYNRILKQALLVLQRIATNHHLFTRTARLALDFEDISGIQANAKTFQSLSFGRKTDQYRYALKLAKLILLQYAPGLQSGREDVLAILFDMNRLFEEFIFRQLKKQEERYAGIGLEVSGQESREFWQGQHLRPDIVLRYQRAGGPEQMILDTKWKVLSNHRPSDEDLRQMYAYNLHLGARRSALLYPRAGLDSTGFLSYSPSAFVQEGHSCRLFFVEVFDEEGRILPDIGGRILKGLGVYAPD